LDFKGDAIKKLRDHKDMLKDVSLLQERVNGISGRLRRLPWAGAKMILQGMTHGEVFRTLYEPANNGIRLPSALVRRISAFAKHE
jgi:hypothetical protein